MDEAPDDAHFFTKAFGDEAWADAMMQPAQGTGINREGLHQALAENGLPSFTTFVQVKPVLDLQFNGGKPSEQG